MTYSYQICHIGRRRSTDSKEEFSNTIEKQIEGILSRSSSKQNTQTFKPREKTVAVRNCTQIDQDVKALVIQRVTQRLLLGHPSTDDDGGDSIDRKKMRVDDDGDADGDRITSKGYAWSDWNAGG